MTREQLQEIALEVGANPDDERVLNRLYYHFTVVAA
jgi:hypothetical protein